MFINVTTFTIKEPPYFEPKMKEMCRECGVIFLILSPFPKLHMSGAARWLADRKALIALTQFARDFLVPVDKYQFVMNQRAARCAITHKR